MIDGRVDDVASILDAKGNDVLQIDASATVFDAIKRMVESNVGSLLVTESGKLTGIVTERDYLRRVTLEGRTEKETPVREIMSAPLVYVTPETSVEECMAVMTERRIRHLPVLAEDGEVAGIVSIGDVVKFQSKQQSVQIRLLTDYISSA
jgi:CBS domain-containing protein